MLAPLFVVGPVRFEHDLCRLVFVVHVEQGSVALDYGEAPAEIVGVSQLGGRGSSGGSV